MDQTKQADNQQNQSLNQSENLNENIIQSESNKDAEETQKGPSYKQKEYWNQRYESQKTNYEWYCGYPELKDVFSKCYKIQKDSRILMVGCGNSKLSEDMYDDGFTNIISTDISDVVIDQLKQDAAQKNKNIIYEVEDCTNLSYPDQSFDFVFDKVDFYIIQAFQNQQFFFFNSKGTLDALSCDYGSDTVSQMMKQMLRVCKQEGSIIIVSFGNIHERRYLFSESIGLEKFRYELCKKYLSAEGQLTNIMRHVSNGLPMNIVLQNKLLLVKVMLQVAQMKKKLKEEIITSNLIVWEETKEDKSLNEKSIEEGTQNEASKNEQNEVLKNEQTEQVQDKNDKEIIKEQGNESQEKGGKQEDEEEEEEEEDEEEEENDKKPKNKFRRQEQCFIYKIQRNLN